MELLRVIDIAGTAAFSIAGAFAAMEKKLDVFGIFIIALVTALGGGTLRDVLIGAVPPRWMVDLTPGVVVLISTLAAMLFTSALRNYHQILLFFDSIGLGFFTILGIQVGITLGLHPAICIALGTITASFGGVMRDIFLNTIPLIFQREIYATTCMVGGIVFFVLKTAGVPKIPLEVISIATIVLLRIFAVRLNWQLPTIGTPSPPST